MYYYTDAEELIALRKENEELKAQIAQLEAKIKKEVKGNGKTKNNERGA